MIILFFIISLRLILQASPNEIPEIDTDLRQHRRVLIDDFHAFRPDASPALYAA